MIFSCHCIQLKANIPNSIKPFDYTKNSPCSSSYSQYLPTENSYFTGNVLPNCINPHLGEKKGKENSYQSGDVCTFQLYHNCCGLRLPTEIFRKHRFCETDLDLIDRILFTQLDFDCYHDFHTPFSNMFSDSY